MSNVRLLGSWPSPFVIRVQMALKLKNVEYEFVETDPYNKSELLLRSNPVYKKIPVLIHGENTICESLIIVQYIDDAWVNGPSILPSNSYDRANARFWATYIDDKLLPLFKELKEASTLNERTTIINKMSENLTLLEDTFIRCSEGKGYFGGDNVGYLDIVFGCYLGWMTTLQVLFDFKYFDDVSTPGLAAWSKRMYLESNVKNVLPSTQMLLDLVKTTQMLKFNSQ